MVHKHLQTVTIAAGSGASNTHPIDGICRFIYIEPTTATTTYKVNFTDEDSDTVKSWDWTRGTMRDFTPLIMHGIYTVNVTNSTANEDFDIKLLVEEKR